MLVAAKSLKIGMTSSGPRKGWERDVTDIQVWTARAQYKLGSGADKRAAITAIEGVLKVNETHPAALAAYAASTWIHCFPRATTDDCTV